MYKSQLGQSTVRISKEEVLLGFQKTFQDAHDDAQRKDALKNLISQPSYGSEHFRVQLEMICTLDSNV